MKPNSNYQEKDVKSLRYGMLIPLALLIASVVSGIYSYSDARKDITEDLNKAMIALANENSRLWTRQDTIATLQKMHKITHKPVIYQASDLNFRNPMLKEKAYFTLALVDNMTGTPKIQGNKIASDSIMLVPEKATRGLAIQVQGFADCSIASVFAVSDQTFPGVLFSLSILSMASLFIWRRRQSELLDHDLSLPTASSIDKIKLTPMQRQFTMMLLDAPERRVDKAVLCNTLWGNKSNAEESLYTLVRRTKTALADTGIEIICNRGDSYELRIKD